MPGKNKNPVKNRTTKQTFTESLTSANKATNDDYSSSASTCSSTKTNPIRSRSPLPNSDVRKNHTNTNIVFTLTKTTSGQAGKTQTTTIPPTNMESSNQQVLTKTAIGQADTAVAATMGDDELIVTNDVFFPEDMETDAKKSMKRKRELESAPSSVKTSILPPSAATTATPTTTQKPSHNPVSQQHEEPPTTSTSKSAKSGDWIPVRNAGIKPPFKIPKNNPDDLRNKLPQKQQDLRQQLPRPQPPQQQHQHPHNSYANVARNLPNSTPPTPWGKLELRVFCTTYRQAPMSQQTWAALHLHVMQTVESEVEDTEAEDDIMEATEAKKMWWHAKMECGIIEVYSHKALLWYRRVVNDYNGTLKAWTWDEKPEPRLKVWIKPQFSHLTPEKYIHLCLKYHPRIKAEQWHLESTTDDEGGKRTAYIRTSPGILAYLKEESNDVADKFTIKGFCGIVVFAIAREAPAGPQSTKPIYPPTRNIDRNNTTAATSTTTPTTATIPKTTTPTSTTTKIRPPELSSLASVNGAPRTADLKATHPAKPTAQEQSFSPSLPDELAKEIIMMASEAKIVTSPTPPTATALTTTTKTTSK